jgi:hypothetical protein
MKTNLENLTEEELLSFTFMRNNPTPLELELAKRLDRAQIYKARVKDPRQMELDFGEK